MTKQVLATTKAPAAIGPYSQGIEINGLIFISGQLPIDPATGEMPSSATEQAKQSLKNLQAILESAGSALEKVVKATVFVQDLEDFAAINAVYQSYFKEPFPARSCVQVARIPKDALVEIEVIATK